MKDMRKLMSLIETFERLDEAAPMLKQIGVPDDIINKVMTTFTISHAAEPVKLEKAPTAKGIEGNLLLRRVLSTGEWFALGKVYAPDMRGSIRWTAVSGDIEEYKRTDSFADIRKHFGKGASEYWFIPNVEMMRAEPEEPESVDALAGGTENIYRHMNSVFLPKIRERAEGILDRIFTSLRKVPHDVTTDGEVSIYRTDTLARDELLKQAKAIENLLARGFDKQTVEDYLQASKKLHYGFGSHYHNQDEFKELISQPLGRQKFAKHFLTDLKMIEKKVETVLSKTIKD